jgi:tRNA(Ile)-lysidine synthase
MPPPPSSHFLQKIQAYILSESLIHRGDHVLVAVSGGPDSVALLSALHSLREAFGIAQLTALHFNHRLRGRDSEDDQSFVEALTRRLTVPLVCSQGDVKAHQRQHRVSLEMAARDCRHGFFREAIVQLQAQCLAVGHTANDQAEEILLRLLRGTGPSGMAGMLPSTPEGVIRPLMEVTRQEILEYLGANGLPHRNDTSNFEPFCQRNLLRLEVFPRLESAFHGRIVDTLSRHARLARDEEDYWRGHLRGLWPILCREESSSRVALSFHRLAALHRAEQKRMLRCALSKIRGNLQHIYAVHLESIVQWLPNSISGQSMDLPERIRVSREGDRLVFTQEPAGAPECASPFEATLIPGPGTYEFRSFRLEIVSEDRESQPAPLGPCEGLTNVRLDADRIRWPLTLRNWRPGDRFCPSGMKGSKKLQDFFVDCRIPRERRQQIPLLCDAEKICWIVGLRLDERVRVQDSTQRVLVVSRSN